VVEHLLLLIKLLYLNSHLIICIVTVLQVHLLVLLLLQDLVVAIMVAIIAVDALIIISLLDLEIGIVQIVLVGSKTLLRVILVSAVIHRIPIKVNSKHSKLLSTLNIHLINLAMVILQNQ
jgi:hypothetical protein